MATIFTGLILWTQAFITQWGLFGTFLVAVLESFIFPVPTAVIIAPSTALGLDPFATTAVATFGSVIGAFVGYALGHYLGHPVAKRLFKKKHLDRFERWFGRYGAWVVLIAAFTPLPFKVITWCSGIFGLDIKKFAAASVIGRFCQFAIAAYVGNLVGPFFLGMML